jgi:hypothetical protein
VAFTTYPNKTDSVKGQSRHDPAISVPTSNGRGRSLSAPGHSRSRTELKLGALAFIPAATNQLKAQRVMVGRDVPAALGQAQVTVVVRLLQKGSMFSVVAEQMAASTSCHLFVPCRQKYLCGQRSASDFGRGHHASWDTCIDPSHTAAFNRQS